MDLAFIFELMVKKKEKKYCFNYKELRIWDPKYILSVYIRRQVTIQLRASMLKMYKPIL